MDVRVWGVTQRQTHRYTDTCNIHTAPETATDRDRGRHKDTAADADTNTDRDIDTGTYSCRY